VVSVGRFNLPSLCLHFSCLSCLLFYR